MSNGKIVYGSLDRILKEMRQGRPMPRAEKPAANKKKLLRYNPTINGWSVGYNSRCVDTKLYFSGSNDEVKELKETYRNYVTDKKELLFDDFDSEKHSVSYGSSENIHSFNLLETDADMVGEKLGNGLYKFDIIDGEYFIMPLPEISSDKRVDLSNSIQSIEKDISDFFNNKDIYSSLEMRFRRGALIYGPPGCGKTFSIIKSVETVIQSNDCIVFILTESLHNIDFLVDFLPVFKGRNVIFIVEEITEKLKLDTESYLSFFDGEMSWDCCYIIATTNYPEDLEDNIVDRPGRFDIMLEVGLPSPEDRRRYLETVLKTTVDDTIVAVTDKFSIAYLKEICLQHKITGRSLLEVITWMKERKENIKRNFKAKEKKLGFGWKEDENLDD